MTTKRSSLAAAFAAAAAVAACLALAGCASTQPGAPPTGTTSHSTPSASPAGTSTAAPIPTETAVRPEFTPMPPLPHQSPAPGSLPDGGVPDAVAARADVQQAVADEAARTGAPASAVELIGYADVTWSDGSLGCPQPGMMYTQALVDGRQLVLAVDGQLASYHAALNGPFTYCSAPVPPAADPGNR